MALIQRVLLMGALAVFAVSPRALAAQNLVVNGAFEQGPNPGSFTTLSGGNHSIPGWTVTGVTVDYIGTIYRGADGGRSIDLDGTPGPGGVLQRIVTRPGFTYTIAFMLSGNAGCAPTVKRMRVDAGPVGRIFTFNTSTGSAQSGKWVQQFFTFKATSTRSTIWFRSFDTPASNCGPALDDVSVTSNSFVGKGGVILVGKANPPPPSTPPPPRPPPPPAMPRPPAPAPAVSPCYTNTGAWGAIGPKPCSGPPGSIIDVFVLVANPTYTPYTGLDFFRTGSADVSVAIAGNSTVGSTMVVVGGAPALLCLAGSGSKWNIRLRNANGQLPGTIGDFTIRGCP